MFDLPPAIATAIPGFVKDTRFVQYADVSATTWVLYDILISFGDEVEHVWSAPWSLPKVCFLFSRYYGVIAIQIVTFKSLNVFTIASEESTFDGSSCIFIQSLKAITAVLLGLSVEIVMLLRVLALYGNTRRIMIFLVTTYIIEFTVTCTLMGVTVHEILVQTIPSVPGEFLSASPLTGCNPLAVPLYFSSYWTAMILFQSILFVMMVLNMIRAFFSRRGLEGAVRTPLLTVFFRDGTVFYAMILAALLANLILFKVSDSPVSQFAVCLHLTGLSLACSRLILNLRILTTTGASNDTTIAPIRFDSGRRAPQNTFDSSFLSGIELTDITQTSRHEGTLGDILESGDFGHLFATESTRTSSQ